MNSDLDFQEVQSRLAEIKEQFDSLILEIENDTPNRMWIRDHYRELKEKLRNEFKLSQTRKGRDRASEFETTYYYPAITDAYLNLTVRTNSPPNNMMLRCLIGGEADISYRLSQMNRQ